MSVTSTSTSTIPQTATVSKGSEISESVAPARVGLTIITATPESEIASGAPQANVVPLHLPLTVTRPPREKDRFSDHADELVGPCASAEEQHTYVRRYQAGIVRLGPALGLSVEELDHRYLHDGKAGRKTMGTVDLFRAAYNLPPETTAQHVNAMVATLTGPGVPYDSVQTPFLSTYSSVRPLLTSWAASPRLTPTERGELLAMLERADSCAQALVVAVESHDPKAISTAGDALAAVMKDAQPKAQAYIAGGR